MGETTTIRIDRATHEELKRLADKRHATVTQTVARAVRLLRQDEIGRQLAAPLDDEETRWLDAELG
jgi:predicted transcriptional regulator